MKPVGLLIIAVSAFAQTVTIGPAIFSGSGLNDATSGGAFTCPANATVSGNQHYVATISATGTPDHFTWTVNGGTSSSPVAITGTAQALACGVTVTFAAVTGHTLTDNWTVNTLATNSSHGVNFVHKLIGTIFQTQGAKSRDIIDLNDWGVVWDGIGTSGTDNSQVVQLALNSVGHGGGGTVRISSPVNGKCAQMQSVKLLYSNVTIEGDGPSSCVQKPANAQPAQMFTTANNGVGGMPVSNIHIKNLLIDGNATNQGANRGLEGTYGIYLGCQSGCSVENVVEQGALDGISVGGWGQIIVTGTVNTTDITSTITGATWANINGPTGTYTTSAPHNLLSGATVAITGVTPSGYSVTGFATVTSPTSFSLAVASNPGSYVSGGISTAYQVTSATGAGFAAWAPLFPLTLGTGTCTVSAVNNATGSALFCTTSQGTQTGASYSTSSWAGVGTSPVRILNSRFVNNDRHGIAHVAGPLIMHGNVMANNGAYGSPACTLLNSCIGDGLDVEPSELGSFMAGSDYSGNYFINNYVYGAVIGMSKTYDANYAPVANDEYASGNGIAGVYMDNGAASSSIVQQQACTVSGTFIDNASAGLQLAWNYSTCTVPYITSVGSPFGVLNLAFSGQVNIQSGSLNGSTYDIANSIGPVVVSGALLMNKTQAGIINNPSRDPANPR